jgi:hypothetical protein
VGSQDDQKQFGERKGEEGEYFDEKAIKKKISAMTMWRHSRILGVELPIMIGKGQTKSLNTLS